jgi:DNA polymerase-3 subunit epsilon
VRKGFLERPSLDEPIALARFVSLDLETTGPHMFTDSIISIGAVAVTERTVRHDDAFEAVLRQRHSSANDNILVHQIGGQAQLAGADPVEALVSCLEFINDSRIVAFRAEFDATVFRRGCVRSLVACVAEVHRHLASVLSAMFPERRTTRLR